MFLEVATSRVFLGTVFTIKPDAQVISIRVHFQVLPGPESRSTGRAEKQLAMIPPHVISHRDGWYSLLADAALGQLIPSRMAPSLVVIHSNPRPPTDVTCLGIFMDSDQMDFQIEWGREVCENEVFWVNSGKRG